MFVSVRAQIFLSCLVFFITSSTTVGEDKKYINDRVFGMDDIRKEVMEKWTPANVEEACGVPEAQVKKVAETMAKSRPGTIVWCMGQNPTHHW